MSLQVLTVPYFKDNYGYYIYNNSQPTKDGGIFVDCGQFGPVHTFLKHFNLKPSCLLTTHKHWDHSGGNQQLLAHYPSIQIMGGQDDKIPAATKLLKNGDIFKIAGINVEAFHTPCHTRGHMLYYVKPQEAKEEEDVKEQEHINEMIEGKKYMLTTKLKHAVFTGDTVFIGGCGRFFEGQPSEMHNAFKVLNTLPDDVRVFCGHQYTIQNLEFCQKVEEKNAITMSKLKEAKELRELGHFTVPSTVKQEKQVNVFMRTGVASVYNVFGLKEKDSIEVMKMLRQYKNSGKMPKL